MALVKVYTSYPINGTSVKGLGIRKTNQVPVSVESLCQFPDTPEIHATNIDPSKQYSISELHRVPSSFSELKNSRIGELLNYNRVIPGEYPCFNLISGESVNFVNTTGWESITHQGTAELSFPSYHIITPSTSSVAHGFRPNDTTTQGVNYRFSFTAKANGYNLVSVSNSFTGTFQHSFDLSNGTYVSSAGGLGKIDHSITDLGAGWFEITVDFEAGSGTDIHLIGYPNSHTPSLYGQSFSGDGVSGILLKKTYKFNELAGSVIETNEYQSVLNCEPITTNQLECTGDGSFYNLIAYDADDHVVARIPVCDKSGSELANVTNPNNKGTLPNSLNWSTQNDFDYVGVYGSSKPKIFKIGKDDTVINTTSYLPTNLNRVDKFETLTGGEYNVSLTQDSAENLVNDPDGEPTGWTEINGQPTLNIYNNFASPDIVPVSGGNLISISGAFPASKIRIRLERLGTDLSSLSGRDATMASRFKKAVINMYGADPSIYLNTVDDFFKMLNGGVETSGAHPNGTNPNFPSDLGMTQANGFSVDLTNADIINAMDNGGVFTNQGTAELLMDGLVADGVHMNTEGSNRWSYPLTRMFNLSVGNGSTNYDITIDTNNLVSNGALSHFGDSFILAHEPILEMYSNMKFTFNYGGGTLPVWVRLYQFSIDELTEVKPATYIDRLKRSGTTTEGDQVQNHEELKSKGDIAFKAMAFTKSDL